MQMKTTRRYDLTSVKMATIKQKTTNVGEDMEKVEPSDVGGGIIKWYGHCVKKYGGSSSN